jgi:Tfp pilus assembly protein PilF
MSATPSQPENQLHGERVGTVRAQPRPVHPYPAMIPPALMPARLTTWSWWAFLKTFSIVLAIGAGGIFLGATITGAAHNDMPLVVGIIVGLICLYLAPFLGKSAVRKAACRSAIAEYTEAIRLDPNNATAYFSRGQVYRILAGEYAWPQMTRRMCLQAIADYDEAIRLVPNYPAAYLGRVNAFAAMRQSDRAIAEYTEAIRLDPSNALAYCARATAYNGVLQFDRSIPDATEAIRLAPDLYLGYDARGFGFWHRGNATRQMADYQQAVADFTESIRLKPTAMDCYLGRALVYRALGDSGKAAADEARAREVLGR